MDAVFSRNSGVRSRISSEEGEYAGTKWYVGSSDRWRDVRIARSWKSGYATYGFDRNIMVADDVSMAIW